MLINGRANYRGMAEARFLMGVLGIAVRAQHCLAPPPRFRLQKWYAGGLLQEIVRAMRVEGKFII
jgi:hypothetical protein